MFIALLSVTLPFALFVLIPAWLLFDEYNIAIAVAYSTVSTTLLAVFWELQKINARAEQVALSRRQRAFERQERERWGK
jgi:Kef-type K+ transport system membrane component KefB